mgnify:CR=1 FL=1
MTEVVKKIYTMIIFIILEILILILFGLAYYICKDDKYYKKHNRHENLVIVQTGCTKKEDKDDKNDNDEGYILDLTEEQIKRINERLNSGNKSIMR